MEFQWEKLFSDGNSEMSGQLDDLEGKKSQSSDAGQLIIR